jgi:hypothetical protein
MYHNRGARRNAHLEVECWGNDRLFITRIYKIANCEDKNNDD